MNKYLNDLENQKVVEFERLYRKAGDKHTCKSELLGLMIKINGMKMDPKIELKD